MESDVRDHALSLIGEYLGEFTRKQYAGFYSHLNDSDIIRSIQELLLEYLGKEKSKQILEKKGLVS